MATDIAIASLPNLPAGQVAAGDIIPIVDISDTTDPGGTTKGTLSSALTQYVNRHNGIFNVTDPAYGADPTGVADSTAAFQAAITAASVTGGVVFMPPGAYAISSQLILTIGVSLKGCGQSYGTNNLGASRLLYGGTGFCIKVGNTPNGLTYGCNLSDFSIGLLTTNSGIWTYGAAKCSFKNIDIEGFTNSTTSIGVQIDGANISSFFNVFENVTCNHVFKGFIHTTTGTTYPTTQTMLGCAVLCDLQTGSIGIDLQSVGGSSCAYGVVYTGGYLEGCKTGVNFACDGASVIGMSFENSAANDVVFGALSRDNRLIACNTVTTIVDNAGSLTNQIFGVTQNNSSPNSQVNVMDSIKTRNMNVLGTFGANGATPQAAFASGGAAPAGGTGATAGAYDTAAHRDALITLVNNIRTALVNNGIMT